MKINKIAFIFLLVACFLSVYSCRQSRSQSASGTKNEKDELRKSYEHSDSLYAVCGRIDTAAFGDFIRKAIAFVEKNPNDPSAPEMLYKAGVGSMIVAKSANDKVVRAEYSKKGLYVFNKFQELYPDNDNSKYCFWQRAIIYEDILGDWRSAESEYRDYITRYPNDSLTPVFEQYLNMLGKTDEQIAEQIGIK